MDRIIASERIASVIKPDSITVLQGDFLATHVALDKLYLLDKFEPNSSEKSFSERKNYPEEEIYKQYICNPENRHQFIAVYGKSGTGKSHLIRWFEARFEQEKPENEVILFIRRSDNTLKGTIRQLLEKPEVQEIANREVYERLVRASASVDEEKLKDMIYHNFIIEIAHDDSSHSVELTNVKRKRLEALLNNEVMHSRLMESNGPIDRMYSKVAETTKLVDRDTVAEFRAEDFYISADFYEEMLSAGADRKSEQMARELMADESGPEEAAKLAAYLNQIVHDVIQRCAGIEPGDFRQIFQDIRKELYRLGKNLTLFIEDVTSFTGVDDALLDALIVEHTGMNEGEHLCRISSIVGTTNDYLQNNFRDNHKDRITKCIYIPTDAMSEASLFEFVGRYLNVMSLPESVVSDWAKNQARPEDYPVHEVKEGAAWEFVEIADGKKLCLYPFTKNSIRYLYNEKLSEGFRTPRYIIRDLIEPIVTDILNNPMDFPSGKYTAGADPTIANLIRSQVEDVKQRERLRAFLCIWGNGQPDQYTEDGVTYISGIRKDILEELNLPIISLTEVSAPQQEAATVVESKKSTVILPEKKEPEVSTSVSAQIQEKVGAATDALMQWSSGKKIDVSANVGTSGVLRAALEDMNAFLFSAIDWQAEGISMDHVNKVKKSSVKIVALENQTKGTGLYYMPADIESVIVIGAFVRWRQCGKSSWNYEPDADRDAYFVTSWAHKIHRTFVELVRAETKEKVPYIDAAMMTEIYRMILCGEIQAQTLRSVSIQTLMESSCKKVPGNTSHSREWLDLASLTARDGEVMHATVQKYFNIIQGDSGGSIVVLNEPAFNEKLSRLKNKKLQIPEEKLNLEDPVKLRRDVYAKAKDIMDRVDKVAQKELEKAYLILQDIYECYGCDEIEEDDINDFVETTGQFYAEANNSRINIQAITQQIDAVKKTAKQIAKAIRLVEDAREATDALTILLAFSGDPISRLIPFQELLKRVKSTAQTVQTKVAERMAALGETDSAISTTDRYYAENMVISKWKEFLERGEDDE